MSKEQMKTKRIRPKKMTLGHWEELTYTHVRKYRGLTWYRTCFGGHDDREDWVADVPAVCLSVSRYHSDSGWSNGKYTTWELAADTKIATCFEYAKSDLAEKRLELKAIEAGVKKLRCVLREHERQEAK